MSWKTYSEEGGGRGAFVFYAHGMPWAVSTRPLTVFTTARRRMFGAREITVDATTNKPYDQVDVLPLLQVPDGWTMEYAPGSNWFNGGDLTIKIDDEQNTGQDSTWYTDRDVWGLEGLHAVTDYRVDAEIRTAILSKTLFDSSTTLYLESDLNDQLRTIVSANYAADDLTYLWIGNECIGVTSDVANDGDGAFHCTVTRGVLKTKAQNHIKNNQTTATIIVADCPVGGLATRRPASLWYLEIDEDGAISDTPDRIWHGFTGTRITRSRGTIKLPCEPWYRNLDTDYKSRSTRYKPKGYVINHDWEDHLVFVERNTVGGWEINKLTLTGTGYKYYETFDILANEINDQLQVARSTSVVNWNYHINSGGHLSHMLDDALLMVGIGSDEPDLASSFVGGPLAWILGLGAPVDSDIGWQDSLMRGDFAKIYNEEIKLETAGTVNVGTTKALCRRVSWSDGRYYGLFDEQPILKDFTGAKFRAEWVMCGSRTGRGLTKSTFFTPDSKWYIGDSSPVESLDTNADLLAGSADNIGTNIGFAFKTSITSIDTVNNTVTTGSLTALDETARFWVRDAMCYIPGVHDSLGGDPMTFSQSQYPQGTTMANVLRGVFGDSTSSLTISKYSEITYIPDMIEELVSGFAEQQATIDFDQLDAFVQPFFTGQIYKITERTEADKFGELLAQELLFHGVSPTWEWDETQRMYRMGFNRLGLPSVTEANASGRTFGDADRQAYKAVKIHNTDGQIYNQLVADYGYQVPTDDFVNRMKIIDDTGLEYTGRNARAINIEAKWSTYVSLLDPSAIPSSRQAAVSTSQVSAAGSLQGQEGATLERLGIFHSPGIAMEYSIKSEETQNEVFTHLKQNVLRQLSYPVPLIESTATMKVNTALALNQSFIATNSDAINPYTGALGYFDVPARARKITYNLGKKGAVTYQIGVGAYRGIAPSCIISGSTITDDDTIEITSTGIDSDPVDQLKDGDQEADNLDAWDSIDGATLVKNTSIVYEGDRSLEVINTAAVNGAGARQVIDVPGDTSVQYLISGKYYSFDFHKMSIFRGSVKLWTADANNLEEWITVNLIYDPHETSGSDLKFGLNSATVDKKFLLDVASAIPVKSLITDGQQEDATADAWTATGGATLAKWPTISRAKSGTRSLEITGGGTIGDGAQQTLSTPVSDAIQLKGWMRNHTSSERGGVYQDGVLRWTSPATFATYEYFDLTLSAADGLDLKFGHTNTSTGIIYVDEVVCFNYVVDTDQSYFSQDDNRPDLSWFDCYTFNASSGGLVLNTACGCTDYSVIIFELGDKDATVYRGTVGSVQLSSGTWIGTITSTDIGLTWDTSANYVMIFGEHGDADTQDCQRAFAYFADEDGLLDDGTVNRPGNRWM